MHSFWATWGLTYNFFYFTGTSGGNILGSLSNLKINACSSSGVVASFGLGTGVVGGGGGQGNEIGVMTLMGGGHVSTSFLSNLMLQFFWKGVSILLCLWEWLMKMYWEIFVFRNICFKN